MHLHLQVLDFSLNKDGCLWTHTAAKRTTQQRHDAPCPTPCRYHGIAESSGNLLQTVQWLLDPQRGLSKWINNDAGKRQEEIK